MKVSNKIGTTRTARKPAFLGYPPPPHDYPYHWVILYPKSKEDKVKITNLKNSLKFQIFEFWNGHYTWHTFWSCLIRCANMKWIRWVFLKILSGHDSVHRRTDGRTDRRTRWYQYTPYQLRWSGGYNNSWIYYSDFIWYYRSRSMLDQVMACCLMAPNTAWFHVALFSLTSPE